MNNLPKNLLHFPSGTFHVPIPASAAEGDAVPEITLNEGSTAGLIAWTNGVQQLVAGLNELHWEYKPDDADNYEEVTGVETIFAETTTTTTTTKATTKSTAPACRRPGKIFWVRHDLH